MRVALKAGVAIGSLLALGAASGPNVDVVIRGGTIYTGAETPPITGDVEIAGDRIVYVGPSRGTRAGQVVEAKGQIVAPGFIDAHTHPDSYIRSDDPKVRLNLPWLAQGVSTIVIGVDGYGTPDVGDDARKLEASGIGTNVVPFVGFGGIRQRVLGKADRAPTPAELARLQTLTRVPIAGAIRFEGSGQITDSAALGDALRSRFVAAGGTFVHDRARGVVEREGRARVLLEQGAPIDADVAVVAAGAASAALVAAAGLHAPLIAERGYHFEGDPGDWPADMPPVVFEDRSMIVTRFAHRLRAASIVEFARTDMEPDPRKWARIRGHVAALGLSLRAPVEPWMGARPTLPDYLPAIGQRGAVAYAFGHQHLGLTLAATSGEALAALLHGDAPAFDLTPFALERFR